MYEFDNSQIEDSGFLGVGEHEVHISNLEIGTSKAGNEKVTITFKNNNGEIRRAFSMMPKAKIFLKRLSVACGISKNASWQLFDLKGRKLKIEVTKQKNVDGTESQYSEVSAYHPTALQEIAGDKF